MKLQKSNLFLRCTIPFFSTILAFILLIFCLVYYQHGKEKILQTKYKELALACETKGTRINSWMQHQTSIAESYAFNSLFALTVKNYLNNHSEDLKKTIINEFQIIQNFRRYKNIILADERGIIEISLNQNATQLDTTVLLQTREVYKTKCSKIGRIHSSHTELCLDIMTPVIHEGKACGVLILQLDPYIALFPRGRIDSTSDARAETFFIIKDKGICSVLTKHSLVPLDRKAPYALAILEKRNQYIGHDSAGQKTVVQINPIDGTNWYILVQIRYHDALRTYNQYAKTILIINAIVIFLLLLAVVFFFYFRQKDIYKNMLSTEHAFYEVHEKFRTTLYSMTDGVITTDEKGRIMQINSIASMLTGWTEKEAFGKPVQNVYHIINEHTRIETENPVARVLRDGIIVGQANNTILMSNDGNERPIVQSGAPIKNKRGKIIGSVLVFRDKTRDRASQRALHKNELRLSKAERIASIGHWELHVSTREIIISESMRIIFGLEEKLLDYNIFSKIIEPSALERRKLALDRLIKENVPYDLEYKIVRPSDGKMLDIRSIAEYDPKENIVFGVIQDITEIRKRVRLFQQFFYDGPVIKMLVDPVNGKIVDANHAAGSFYGWPLEELKKMNTVDINTLPFEKQKEDMDLVISRGEGIFKFKHKLSNGEIRDVEVFCGTVVLDDQNLIFSIIHDITDRKKAETALRESEERFRRTFFTIPDTVVIIRRSDRAFVDVNEEFLKFSGYSKTEVIGKTTMDLNIWADPDEAKKLHNALHEQGFYINKETRFRRKDGTIVHAVISARSILLNEVPHTIAIVHDISDRKAMEEELLKAKEKAEESDRLKTSFLHNISHEIRTPMNGIVGFANLLRNKDLPDNERENYINVINSSADQLLSIVDDVLEISRIESGTVPIHNSTFALNELLDEIFHLFNRRVQVEFNYSCELSHKRSFIESDKEKIKQIFAVLINNAIKFTAFGEITFGYNIRNSFIEFYVKDTGIGIPKHEISKVFQRFYQVENEMTRRYGGNGLGLNIAKSLAEMMGGKMWIASEPGKGSEFFFTVPFRTSVKESESKESGLFDLSGYTILVVEDEPTNFEFLRIILSIKGATVKWAQTGEDAIKMVEEDKPDLVLMDLKMPVMDGLDASRRILKIYPDLPIIAQTAYSLPEEKEQAVAAGCVAFVSKPIKAENLFELICQAMNKQD